MNKCETVSDHDWTQPVGTTIVRCVDCGEVRPGVLVIKELQDIVRRSEVARDD